MEARVLINDLKRESKENELRKENNNTYVGTFFTVDWTAHLGDFCRDYVGVCGHRWTF